MVSWCCLWVLNRRSFLWGFSRGRLFGGGNSTPIPDLPWTSTPSLISSAYGFTCGLIFLSFFNCKTLFLLFWARKHGRGTRGAAPASDADARALVRVCIFFFFVYLRFALTRLDSCRLGSIRAKSASILTEPSWFDQNWAVLAIAGRIGRRPIRPKQAENGWNMPKMVEIGLEYGRKSRNLPSSFFFC